ncbi:hypothetical protein [Bradyrhizobium elkanii]|uniref:hypothetical protein n=1 Tax=Bradyrhizobium elkanii TaxID=29448 RepID=UPI002168494A|nr:hypothetical protein [Bradyrhizobium elkanii]MCS3524448.1 hypothetical protein [Bradyrhizobium elkanii]MCS4072104.1 hypothetical protein [Bradyrhizobium elkanii]MCS4078737.1 hypothetical protein [Bradyrhizobium elkanii]MDH6690331.1 hypothetical protein [Bradyrhizobium elkanii]
MNQKSSLRKIPLFVSQALTANNLGILGEIKSVHPGEIIGIRSQCKRLKATPIW